MAYIFSDDQNGDAANNVATNIFQANAGGTSNNPPDQNGSPKPVGSGDQSAAVSTGGNGQGGGQQQQQQASNSASTSKEAIRRNEGKTQSPINIGNLTNDMSTAKQNLQKEADNYVTTQQGNGQDYDSETIHKALTGDQDSFGKIGGRLHQAAPQYQNFAPTPNTEFTTRLNDLSDSNLRNYFKGANGPATTQGDAAFDTMLLNKNNQFKQDRAQALQQAQLLANDTSAIKSDTDTKGQAALTGSYDKASQHIKDTITNELNGIRNPAEAQAAAAEAQRQKYATMSAPDLMKNTPGYQAWLQGIASQVGKTPEQQAYLRDFANQSMGLGQRDTGQLSFAGNVGSDPLANFVNVSRSPVTASNFLNQQQADELNSGYNLLDGRHTGYAASGPAESPFSFNSNAAKAYLYNRMGDQEGLNQLQAQKDQEDRALAEHNRQVLAENERIKEEQNDRDKEGMKNPVQKGLDSGKSAASGKGTVY